MNEAILTKELLILTRGKNEGVLSMFASRRCISKYLTQAGCEGLFSCQKDQALQELLEAGSTISLPCIEKKIGFFGPRYRLCAGPVAALEYFTNWLTVMSMNFVNSTNISDGIYSIARQVRSEHGEQDAELLLERLWADKWMVDCKEWARIRFRISSDAVTSKNKNVKNAIESRLEAAREESTSLDQWFEMLYNIMPLIQYGLLLYEKGEGEDSKRYHRYLDEMAADIFGVMGYCLHAGAIKGNEYPLTDQCLTPLLEEDIDHCKVQRALSYNYRGRVIYPKFWYDDAVRLLEDRSAAPERLNVFDHRSLAADVIVISPKFAESVCEFSATGEVSSGRLPKVRISLN